MDRRLATGSHLKHSAALYVGWLYSGCRKCMTSNKLHWHEKQNCIEVDMVQSFGFLHLFLHPLFLFMSESLNLSLVLFSLLFLVFFFQVS